MPTIPQSSDAVPISRNSGITIAGLHPVPFVRSRVQPASNPSSIIYLPYFLHHTQSSRDLFYLLGVFTRIFVFFPFLFRFFGNIFHFPPAPITPFLLPLAGDCIARKPLVRVSRFRFYSALGIFPVGNYFGKSFFFLPGM